MKRYVERIGILVLICCFVGCANATYVEVDPTTGAEKRITYKVVGRRDFKDIDVDMNKGRIKVGSAKNDSGRLGDALINATNALDKVAETALNASKVVAPIP